MATDSKNIISKANNNFTQEVYKNLLSSSTSNTVVSPFSIHLIMGLVSYGADNESKTQLLKGLGIEHSQELLDNYKQIMDEYNKCSELKIADKIFMAENFKINSAFQEIAQKYFSSEISCVDFSKSAEAAREINKWVESKTNNLIRNLIDAGSIDSLTRLILINAIYFKDKWASPFRAERTHPEPFYTDNTNSYNVQMMHKQAEFRLYTEDGENGFYALELPYANKRTSMHIILPKEREGLAKLQDHLFKSGSDFSETFNKIIRDSFNQKVVLSLPKFKIESTWDLKSFCEGIGMKVIFTDEADFSKMTSNKEPLKVDKIVQKAFIEVNEEGTEAAAATAVLIRKKRCLDINDPKCIKADHPFLYIIRSNADNVILFMGTITNPDKVENIDIR